MSAEVRAAMGCPRWCVVDHECEVLQERAQHDRLREDYARYCAESGTVWDGRWGPFEYHPRHYGREVTIADSTCHVDLRLESMPEATDGSGALAVEVSHNGDTVSIPVRLLERVMAGLTDLTLHNADGGAR